MESPARTLSSGLAEHVEAVCRHYLSNGRRCGNYWVVGDVNNNAGRSLYVRLKGPLSGKGARGRWTDAATSEHGDLLDLIRAREGLTSFRDTLDEARRFLRAPRAMTSSATRQAIERARHSCARPKEFGRRQTRSSARRQRPICAREKSPPISMTRRCAITRRCSIVTRPTLLPQRLPALVAAVTDNSGKITGIHRTFLDPERNTKANVASPRRSLGVIFGNGVRFGVIRDVAVVGEGIETVSRSKAPCPSCPWSRRSPPRIWRHGNSHPAYAA